LSYVPVAREGDVAPGEVKVVDADGKSLALGHCADGTWGAIDNVCTHDGGTLGEVRSLPAVFPVNAYPVRVVAGEVQVDVGVPTKELEIG